MRTSLTTAAAVLMLCAPGIEPAHAHSPIAPFSPPAPSPRAPLAQAPAAQTPSAKVEPDLVGTWRSTPNEEPLTTDLAESVWGRGARSVRRVDLVVRPTGEGTLTVSTQVVDARGRTQAASASVEEAHLIVGEPRKGVGPRTERTATVVSAERRYPDDPGYKWPLEGLRVTIATIEGQPPGQVEIRYDTPEGRGSFWETLRKTARRTPPRAN